MAQGATSAVARAPLLLYWAFQKEGVGAAPKAARARGTAVTKVIKREHAERARAHESVLSVPEVMRTAPGIAIQGRKIRSLVFSTDLAVICHCDADAVLAVYPFTCQPAITQALVAASQRPVFNGVGGSITQGERCVEAALHSEMSGVAAVVVNTSIPVESISALVEKVAVPVCVTACAADDVVRRQIAAGASIVNVAAGSRTPQVVEALRREYPDLPIIATGGPTDDAIRATIAAGADAVSWTPPAIADLEREVMEKARRLAAELL